jgi:hypothetical protein
MPKRALLTERPVSVASECVDRSKKRMKCLNDSPSIRNQKNPRNDACWLVKKVPALPYLYVPQRTSAVVKNACIEDITASIESCVQSLRLEVGDYDSLNAKATFTLDGTMFTVQIFRSFVKEYRKVCFIVELLRINGSIAVFHNVAISVLNTIKQNDSCSCNASDQEQLESLQKNINCLQL